MAAITAAAITTAGAIYASKKAGDQAKEQNQLAREGIAASDPYAPHRGAAAEKLNALIADPSSIANTAEYKARQQAVARQLASQGYTGSGNALIAAADAAGTSYQQSFDNLALLAGVGATPGAGYGNALSAAQAGNDNKLGGYAGIINNLGNLASTIGDKRTGGGGQKTTGFNQGVTAGPPEQ
jgi:hypothetical protein